MDILHLVVRLEELFNEGRPIWFTRNVMVDEDRLLDIIDQMRVSIPDEIKKAQQILAQRDRILAQAQEEASRKLSLANEQSEALLEQHQTVQAAEVRAEQIIAQAKIEAENTRISADDYVLETLTRLEAEMDRLLQQARNGIRTIQEEQQTRVQVQQPQPQLQNK
jgi:hypothetical protein